MRPFDEELISEYIQSIGKAESTSTTYRGILVHFGNCWEASGGNVPEAWGRYVKTRKKSQNPVSDTKYMEQGKNLVQRYSDWLSYKHRDIWMMLQDAPDRVSIARPVDDIDFDDLSQWLITQQEFIKQQRTVALENIVKLADNPESPEFMGAVRCVKDYAVTLNRYANLLILVQMYKEA